MSTTYTNPMDDAFTINQERSARAYYGTGVLQEELTDEGQDIVAATTLLAITDKTVTLTGASDVTMGTNTAPLPVGLEFTLINGLSATKVITLTNTDGGAFDCGLESDYSTRSALELQVGQKVVLRATGLLTTEMVSTTGDWA